MSKQKTVALKDLKVNLFVRQALNQDHALFLAELIENGVELPPIRITSGCVVIDGRHRIEAHELNDRVEIKAEIVDVKTENEMIAEAYKANVGGSLPPTPQDTEHTIMLLLERGEAMKRIGEMLGLPAGMARKYINSVKSKTSRQKLMKAASAITDGGLTVAKAAEQYEVKLEKLKEILSGHKRKNKQGISEIQRGLTKTHKSLSQKNAALIRSLLDKYEDGDVTERQVREIFSHIDQLQKRAARAISDWKKRFDSANGKTAKAS
jgi:ParB-like chromosome segregation protein Spo0J